MTGTSRSLLIEAGTFRGCGDGETEGLLGDAEATLVMDGIPDLGFGLCGYVPPSAAAVRIQPQLLRLLALDGAPPAHSSLSHRTK